MSVTNKLVKLHAVAESKHAYCSRYSKDHYQHEKDGSDEVESHDADVASAVTIELMKDLMKPCQSPDFF